MSRHLRTRQLNNKAASYTNQENSPEAFRELHSHSAGKTTAEAETMHKRQKSMLVGGGDFSAWSNQYNLNQPAYILPDKSGGGLVDAPLLDAKPRT